MTPKLESYMGEFSAHVLEYLSSMKDAEPNVWLRDDLQIAYLTVLWADRGHPEPARYATQLTLGVGPEEVWPRIVATRKAKLGTMYEQFFPAEGLPPKKPARSERITTTVRKSQNK